MEQLDQARVSLRGQMEQELQHLQSTVKGVLLSMLVVPLCQGASAFIGFVMFGVPSPLLWSVIDATPTPAHGPPAVTFRIRQPDVEEEGSPPALLF